MEENTQQQQDNTQQPSPELTISDLNNVRSILDVAVRRGSFGGAEISSVGQVFDKLNTFLNSVNPPQPQKPDQPTQQ